MSIRIDYIYEVYDEIAKNDKASDLVVDATLVGVDPVEVRLFKNTTTNAGVFLIFSETNRDLNPASVNAVDVIKRELKRHPLNKFTSIVVTKDDYATANKMAEYIITQLR